LRGRSTSTAYRGGETPRRAPGSTPHLHLATTMALPPRFRTCTLLTLRLPISLTT
ncbi:MAG: hypothetical protein SGPRY_008731, partial [Prymnesium sp.]